MDIELVKSLVVDHPDFPKKGILFRDMFPVLRDPVAFEMLIAHLQHRIAVNYGRIDGVAALDARGFLIGPILAARLGAAFVPIRKGGKLPGATHQVKYEKEYGTDVFEMQSDSVEAGKRYVIVDDLLATGGSLHAGCKLITDLKGIVVECLVVIELTALEGKSKVPTSVYSMIKYDD